AIQDDGSTIEASEADHLGLPDSAHRRPHGAFEDFLAPRGAGPCVKLRVTWSAQEVEQTHSRILGLNGERCLLLGLQLCELEGGRGYVGVAKLAQLRLVLELKSLRQVNRAGDTILRIAVEDGLHIHVVVRGVKRTLRL